MQAYTSAINEMKHPISHADKCVSFKDYYFYLLNGNNQDIEQLKQFVEKQLDEAPDGDNLPQDALEFNWWLEARTQQVGKQYQAYLIGRENGQPRQLFKNKSHALYFIKTVAPTKLVDGSWLYGLTNFYAADNFSALISTYLDEIGAGEKDRNHVSLYKNLMRSHGIEFSPDLEDKYYQQGAIQLALGHTFEYFVPEIIGFNLGYEQLPLHLLITAYELKELGIDPFYFTLHITIDNSCNGHAKNAVQSVLLNKPKLGNTEEYFRRIAKGYQLNEVGIGTNQIIATFDIEKELISILKSKAHIGKFMHGNYCKVDGLLVNEWLSRDEKIPDFLAALQKIGWINKNENPKNSKFWRMIDDHHGVMYGVFNEYEKQIIFDWIAGAGNEDKYDRKVDQHLSLKNVLNFPSRNSEHEPDLSSIKNQLNNNSPHALGKDRMTNPRLANYTDEDDALFKSKLDACKDNHQLMLLLIDWLAPAKHHTQNGLKAAKMYMEKLNGR